MQHQLKLRTSGAALHLTEMAQGFAFAVASLQTPD
jgi:hypothetical protein